MMRCVLKGDHGDAMRCLCLGRHPHHDFPGWRHTDQAPHLAAPLRLCV